jgi:hypothetical protein
MIILKFNIILFFKLLKHRIPAYYFYIKYKLGLINSNDIIMIEDCVKQLHKDRNEMLKKIEEVYND